MSQSALDVVKIIIKTKMSLKYEHLGTENSPLLKMFV